MSYLRLLGIGLLVFWLVLSGFWDNGLLLFLGVLSTALVLYIARRIEQTYPLRSISSIVSRLPAYWCWLFVEIVKANMDVLKRIWMPQRYPVSPSFDKVPMTQHTRIGKTVYANSITLTPGTVSVKLLEDRQLLVHALNQEALNDLKQGEMDRRVSALEVPPK